MWDSKSTGASGTTWYFSYKGSSQTLVGVQVRDSNASPNTGTVMAADGTSRNLGKQTRIGPSRKQRTRRVRYWVASAAGLWNSTGSLVKCFRWNFRSTSATRDAHGGV